MLFEFSFDCVYRMFTNATRTSKPNVCVNGAFVPLLSETNEIEINGLNENNVKSAKSSLNTETAFIIS